MYRKGVDLIAGVIYRLRHYPNLHFIIGGDGPKRGLLEEVRERANMQDRVTMLGALEHAKVMMTLFVVSLIRRIGSSRLCTLCTRAFTQSVNRSVVCGLKLAQHKKMLSTIFLRYNNELNVSLQISLQCSGEFRVFLW